MAGRDTEPTLANSGSAQGPSQGPGSTGKEIMKRHLTLIEGLDGHTPVMGDIK